MSHHDLPWAKKSLGQHFLNNNQIIAQICEPPKKVFDGIMEIGPGPGILTKTLSQMPYPFLVVEKDKRFISDLQQLLSPAQVVEADALAFCWDSLPLYLPQSQHIWLVSNLPYNISVPLMLSFLHQTKIKVMTLMLQQEVADRILSQASKKEKGYGLGHLIQNYFEVEKVCHAYPQDFTPPPKVTSTVIRCFRKEIPLIPLKEFSSWEKFLRLSFSQRRKTLKGLLKDHHDQNTFLPYLTMQGYTEQVRAEDIQRIHFQELYRLLHP
jgi:16S rRNA (adenine1518-N6/adenine1519-N6)-dimethyltransferase